MQHQLTKQDIQKMEEEIEYRKLVVRKEALEDVKTARAHGDLSENFEYKAAIIILSNTVMEEPPFLAQMMEYFIKTKQTAERL